MIDKLTLFHDASKGGKKQWSIWLEPNANGLEVVSEWGLVGCKLQVTRDIPAPRGKAGTKAYKDQPTVAREEYERKLKKKRDEGYQEAAGTKTAERDIFSSLDKQFVPSKPINDMSLDEMMRLDRSGKLLIQRKRDGQRHLVLVTSEGRIRLYSRRMEEMTDNFPRLCQALTDLCLPPQTILDGEIIIDRQGVDDFKAVNSITKALPAKAAAREALLPVRYMIFDVLYLAGEATWKMPYTRRWEFAQMVEAYDRSAILCLPEVLEDGLTYAIARVRELKWEGLVLWQKEQPTIVRFGGQPKRVNCAKWKPICEGDFIATGYELGSGSLSAVVGALYVEEHGPDGKIRKCGRVGTGFDYDTRKAALSWAYPCVVQLEYDKQEPDTFNLRFPVFVRKRDDKTPEECIGRDLSCADPE